MTRVCEGLYMANPESAENAPSNTTPCSYDNYTHNVTSWTELINLPAAPPDLPYCSYLWRGAWVLGNRFQLSVTWLSFSTNAVHWDDAREPLRILSLQNVLTVDWDFFNKQTVCLFVYLYMSVSKQCHVSKTVEHRPSSTHSTVTRVTWQSKFSNYKQLVFPTSSCLFITNCAICTSSPSLVDENNRNADYQYNCVKYK